MCIRDRVKTAQTNEINVYDILKYDTVVVTKHAKPSMANQQGGILSLIHI